MFVFYVFLHFFSCLVLIYNVFILLIYSVFMRWFGVCGEIEVLI